MNEVARALIDAVGSGAVVDGESVNADYGTDETLKAILVPPLPSCCPGPREMWPRRSWSRGNSTCP